MKWVTRPMLLWMIAALCAATGAGVAEDRPRVVVIGFDGADARLVEKWMGEGRLPNLAALRDEGTYSRLLPTNPPQTPVSWSSFATGLDPGRTEVFDWLKRDADNYLPDFAMISATRRQFGIGERNGLVTGVAVGVLTLVLILFGGRLLGCRWLVAALIATVCGGSAALAVGSLAQRWLPVEVPDARNNRQGKTMWQLASEAGLRARVIRVPATFPAEALSNGEMLSGLGVPDMRGGIGTPAYYTSDRNFKPGDNEFSLELIPLPARRGRIASTIIGPSNKAFFDFVVDRRLAEIAPQERSQAKRRLRRELEEAGTPRRLDLPLELEVTDRDCTIRVGERRATLATGEWSDWFDLAFPINPLVDAVAPLHGIVRFRLLALEPELALYMSPINFHPDCHPIAFAWPPDFSEELRNRFGIYKTLGWDLDTWSLPSGVGDERQFLEDLDFTESKYEEIMVGLLAEKQDDLYIQIFYFPDRVGHLFWRHIDPGHPLYDPVEASRWGGEMLRAYERMDRIVGVARALAGRDATFLVCSDHGFSSFRRGVNYNNWLVENGLMTLKDRPAGKATLEQLFDTRELFANVDWSRTKAYALGLGSIYVNLAGREKFGIVLPGEEYDTVRRQIKEGLEALVDPATGDHPVQRVWLREESYREFDPRLIPDLRAANHLNYRVSWQTSLGGFGETLVEDNLKAWSGDHCSNAPELVPGILFINRPITNPEPRMVDLAPTILRALGVGVPDGLDGRPLL